MIVFRQLVCGFGVDGIPTTFEMWLGEVGDIPGYTKIRMKI